MKNYSVTSWKDYWNIFDELMELLKADKQEQIISEFINSQRYVNGLTDGWFDFKSEFEKTLSANRNKMSVDQTDIADFLIMTINKSLANR